MGSQGSLGGDSAEGQHSEATVVDFLELHVVNSILGLALQQLDRIKAEISGFTVELSLGYLDKSGTGAEFEDGNDEEKESH